jgi:uncharacterized membrane protein YfcA
MSLIEALLVALAGVAAGTINAVVGSGTLITFPALLAVGYPPVVANVSNTVGLVPGSISGAIGYRREMAGQRGRILYFGSASLVGGIAGAIALLALPASAFKAIVPAFIAVALVLIVLQPWLARRVAERRPHGTERHVALWLAVLATGVYGGYFGAAQGILLIALFGVVINDHLQRLNALRNMLALLVNLVSGVLFIFIADVSWLPVVLIAAGSIVGGQIGARYGRRLSPTALRGVVVVVGVVAIVQLLT